nr:uncharacterized protein LOC124493488 [Dermatophagoides farinae]
MHTHKLIRLIRARPMLYNFEMEDYNNKLIAERKWSEIAIEMNASVSECKTKWNSLRTAFNTYLNKLKRMKKPRTKWIHADEMAFLKQYLKRNRYSASASIHSNENNNSIHHLSDKDILSTTDAAFLMTLTTMKSDEHDLSNSNHSGSHVDYYDMNGQTPSPTHSIMNLSMTTNRARSNSISSFDRVTTQQLVNKSNVTYGNSKILEPNHVDVETCDDNDHECQNDQQDDDDDDNDHDDDMSEIQHHSKRHKLVDKQELDGDEEKRLNNVKMATTVSSTSNKGEKMKRITLEAPESMLICFDVHHHNHSRHHHSNNPSKWTPTTVEDVTGSEMDIFADYVAMKLKSFSVANRLETMTKIWHLLSEATLRQYSTTPPALANLIPIVASHCPPGSTNLTPQDLR